MIKKKALFQRKLKYIYPEIERGKGVYLYDSNNKRFIDGSSGVLTACLGHGIAAIVKESFALAKKVSYLHGAQFTMRHIGEYAEKLCGVAPRGLDKVYFVSGGSEAVETAIKLSRQYHYESGKKKKYKIVYTYPGFHGATLGALSVTGEQSVRKIYSPLLSDFPSIPGCFCYHCAYGLSYPACEVRCARALENAIKKEGKDTIAAFIVEPVIGAAAGAVVPVAEYLGIVKEVCRKNDVLVIFDEVMCGFGRTGKWFACQHWDCSPDIALVGKGISAGLVPLAALFCSSKITAAIKKGSGHFIHGFTYVNNPFTASIGKTVFEYLEDKRLVELCGPKGRYLFERLKELFIFDAVGDVRGLGLFAAVEFVRDRSGKTPFARAARVAEKIVDAALREGLNVYLATGFCGDGNGDAIILGPPYIVTYRQIDEMVGVLKKAVGKVLRKYRL